MMMFKLKIATTAVCLILLCLPLAKSSTTLVPAGINTGSNNSFQYLVCSGFLESNSRLILAHGDHFINSSESCLMSDISNITITSTGIARVLCSSNLQGHNFIFLNITNLILENVLIEGCGRVLPSNLPTYVNNTFGFIAAEQKIAFLLSHATNLSLLNVTFLQSFGFSIVAVNMRGRTELLGVTIASTNNFRHPGCHRNVTDMSCSGSGAAFLYSDTIIDEPSPDETSLTVASSSFINNENAVPDFIVIPILITLRSGFMAQDVLLTGAPSLAIYLGQRSYNVDISIISSRISNNLGYISAIAIIIINNIRENFIEMKGCILESNEGGNIGFGGALSTVVIHYLPDLQFLPNYPDVYNFFNIHNTSFIRNSANMGGAMYFYFSPQNVSDFSATLDNVTFKENAAFVSSAFEVFTRQATFVQSVFHILMKDVIASGNTFPNSSFTSSTNVENSAAFVFSQIFNITVSGSNLTHKSVFSFNSPGAFLVLGGNFYLQGYVEFIENKALRGGAISMYDSALLFFHEGSRVNFTKNSATEVGGAIYANSLGTATAPTCVFQVIGKSRIFHSNEVAVLDLDLSFMNNTAVDGGNSIYANPLYSCAYLPESSLVDVSVFRNASIIYNSIFNFRSSVSNILHELSSIPERVCHCSEGVFENTSSLCMAINFTISEFPGQTFVVNAFPADFDFSPVTSVVFAELDSNVHTLGKGQAIQQLTGVQCTPMEFTIFGPENKYTTLSLYTRLAGQHLIVNISMKECPPGFLLDNEGEQTCKCDPFIINAVRSMCNLTDYTINRRPFLWVGVHELENVSDDDVVYVETCPTGFCMDNSSVDLTIPDGLCKEGRTGILCGACKGNLSVVFGSPDCMECSNYWLFTIPLYAVAGIGLVAVLFLLHLTVEQGTINAVVFYVNIVGVNSNIFFATNSRGFFFVWISLMNLELGFPVCFYNGMNEAAKAGLQAIFPVYLLLICFFIIIISEKSRRVAKLTAYGGLPVLATTFYLSFTKMLKYVIDILTFSTLRGKGYSHFVWFYDGNLRYFIGNHAIIAFVPALITLFFIIFYLMTLIFIKVIEHKSSKLKPIMDVYGGPYKDRYRFWFGLRLLVLSVMCLTYALLGTDNPVMTLSIQLLFLILYMLTQAYIRPFKNAFLNGTDIFFMIYLFLLALSTIQAYQFPEARMRAPTVVILLVSVAFLHFIAIVIWHLFESIYHIPIIREKTEPLISKYNRKKSMSAIANFAKASMTFKRNSVPEVIKRVNATSLNSMNTENTNVTDIQVSSTEVSLDNAVNFEVEKRETFTHFRESLLET